MKGTRPDFLPQNRFFERSEGVFGRFGGRRAGQKSVSGANRPTRRLKKAFLSPNG